LSWPEFSSRARLAARGPARATRPLDERRAPWSP
jgi:hypothetical protein